MQDITCPQVLQHVKKGTTTLLLDPSNPPFKTSSKTDIVPDNTRSIRHPLRPQTPTCQADPRPKSASPPSFTTTARSLHFRNMSSSRDRPSKKPGVVLHFHQALAKNVPLTKQYFAKEESIAKYAFATTGLAGHPTSNASAWVITRSQRFVRIGDELETT